MDWFNDLIKKYPHLGLLPAAAMGIAGFVGNLAIALSDGDLDGNEIHNLLSGANGAETIIVMVVLIALRAKSKSK